LYALPGVRLSFATGRRFGQPYQSRMELHMTKGTIVNIERFAIHDGPGIRTVIFMKGCPLRCKWCSTPESQTMSLEMGYFVNKCIRCAKCAEVCPLKAVTVSGSGEILTDRLLCDDCGKCVEVCPTGARTMVGKEVTVGQIVEEVEKDSVFYWNSGGGITLSGGEPTMQPKFSLEILKECKERGIHTTMETCGYVEWDILDEMLKYLDLVYFDIKHMFSVEHEKLTAKRNKLILENCRKIIASYPDVQLILRMPVIPGCNDSDGDIVNTAKFARQLKRVMRLELLPYHKFGVHMYQVLLRNYPLPNVEPPGEDRMHDLEELAKSCGIPVQIGG